MYQDVHYEVHGVGLAELVVGVLEDAVQLAVHAHSLDLRVRVVDGRHVLFSQARKAEGREPHASTDAFLQMFQVSLKPHLEGHAGFQDHP